MDILVATSIAPRNIAPQRAAINSWLDSGLKVVAVNSDAEVSLLKPDFTDIEFFNTGPDEVTEGGRQLVSFDNILESLKQSNVEICGIINSDIHLKIPLESPADFLTTLAGSANDALVFGSRIDVEKAGDWQGTSYEKGYDYFFFSQKIIDCYPPSAFQFGAPWWDMWASVLPILKGFELRKITTPFAYHVKHDTVWGDEWSFYANHLAQRLLDISRQESSISGNQWSNLCQNIIQGALLQNEIINLKYGADKLHQDEAANHFQIFLLNMLSTFIPQFISQAATKISLENTGN